MNTLHLQKEAEDLITIVNTEFNLDLQTKSRRRAYVDARRVYSLIMRDRGFSLTAIGRSLEKDHATIIHYLKNIHIIFKHCPNLHESYQRIAKISNKGKDPIDDMDVIELRHHIYRLRQGMDSLSLRLTKTENRLDFRDEEAERLSDIFETIRKKLPVGKETLLKSKLITVINGL
jgi:hypothetical protein